MSVRVHIDLQMRKRKFISI